jgi:hypothetical protein
MSDLVRGVSAQAGTNGAESDEALTLEETVGSAIPLK